MKIIDKGFYFFNEGREKKRRRQKLYDVMNCYVGDI